MSSPLYILIEISLFLIGIKRLHQLFQDADVFFDQQKNFRLEERDTLQLAGLYAVRQNLDQARLFLCEREPTLCTVLSEKHQGLIQPLQMEIASREAKGNASHLTAILRKQNPRLRPASWPNWVPGLRFEGKKP